MNIREEIAKVAYDLYEKSGCITGRDFQNWLDAERIVLTRHASQDIEEPEGEEPIIVEERLVDEVEGIIPMHSRQNKEETIVLEEMEVKSPAIGTKEDLALRIEKIKQAVFKGNILSPKKKVQKSSDKYH